MTTNVYDHEAVIHGFVRKALRYAGDEADFDEREQLEEELPEYAETIITGGGYDLDKRIAALVAENERLTRQLKDLDAQLDRLSDQLYLEKQASRNQRDAHALLSRDYKKMKKALQQIAAGNPAKPGQWLTDVEMVEIARRAWGEE